MRKGPREPTLADYLRSLRRGWAIIVLAALVCAAAALGASKVAHRSYEAEATLSIQDPNSALALAGAGVLSSETPLQLASTHAEQVTRQEVVAGAQAKLHSPLTLDALRRKVSVSVDPNSALVAITAQSSTAQGAAAIANAFASVDASLTTAQARRQYGLEAAQFAKKTRSATTAPGARAIYLAQLARLQTLSSVAAPVQVNTTARVPTAPSSPRPLRNTLAALGFGLLLGIVLAYGRDAIDRRLRRSADVEGLLPHPVIGFIPDQAFLNPGKRSGASSNGMASAALPDLNSFQVLRQNLRYLAAEPLNTVLITSAMPEEGKSTVAACLAAAIATSGRRALLVECDLRRPVLADRLGLPASPGLTDHLIGNADPSQIVRPVAEIQVPSNGGLDGQGSLPNQEEGNLVCITAGTRAPRPTELLASDRFGGFLKEVGDVYDTVILDSAPLLTVADTLELIPEVAGALVCIRLRQTTREQARGVHAALDRLPERPVGIVVTGVREADEGYYGYYSHYAGAAAAPR